MKKDSKNLDFEFNKIVGEVLKKTRLQKGMSLEDVCRKTKTGIPKQRLSDYEGNKYRITNTTFQDVCHALNESPEDVYEEIINNFDNNRSSKTKENNIGISFKQLNQLEDNSTLDELVNYIENTMPKENQDKLMYYLDRIFELSKELDKKFQDYKELTDEEMEKVLEYIDFLKSKRS